MVTYNLIRIRWRTGKTLQYYTAITHLYKLKYYVIMLFRRQRIEWPVDNISRRLTRALLYTRSIEKYILLYMRKSSVQINCKSCVTYIKHLPLLQITAFCQAYIRRTIRNVDSMHATLIGFYRINFKLLNFPVNLYVINFLRFPVVDRWRRKLIDSRMHIPYNIYQSKH